MYKHDAKSIESKVKSTSNAVSQLKNGSSVIFNDISKKSTQTAQLQAMADSFLGQKHPIQQKNNTGLPDNLKSGIENLSGYSMDDVKVHFNSNKPAQLQAHAYAQGNQIHIAPGQEKHLPHEAWHVVQQKQGRVKPTMQLKGKVNINDDSGLEKEADVMGAKAMQLKSVSSLKTTPLLKIASSTHLPLQRSVNVSATERDESVVIKAVGKAKDFQDGDSAKNDGWNGVEKYKARVEVGDKRIVSGTLSNDYLNAQAGHVLAEQNGGLGSDPNNVFAQDGGVNNGLYRSGFENPMRKALNEADEETGVSFRAVLYGENITKGKLSKISPEVYASSEDTDGTSSDEDSELSFGEWKAVINQMALAEYGLGLDDLPDEPYMTEYEEGTSPEDFYDQYMKDGKAY